MVVVLSFAIHGGFHLHGILDGGCSHSVYIHNFKTPFYYCCGSTAAVQRSAQAAGFRKAKPQPLLSGKKCEKMLQLIISHYLLEAFSHTFGDEG